MTPSHSFAAGCLMLRCSLESWRHVADAWEAALREQQDAMLKTLEHDFEEAMHAPEVKPARKRRPRALSAPSAEATEAPQAANAAP